MHVWHSNIYSINVFFNAELHSDIISMHTAKFMRVEYCMFISHCLFRLALFIYKIFKLNIEIKCKSKLFSSCLKYLWYLHKKQKIKIISNHQNSKSIYNTWKWRRMINSKTQHQVANHMFE